MKILLSLVPVMFLAGCHTNPVQPEPSVVIKYKYIANQIPSSLTDVPAKIKTPDDNASDKEIAGWILDSAGRTKILEEQLGGIRTYQSDRLESIKKSYNIKEEDIIR